MARLETRQSRNERRRQRRQRASLRRRGGKAAPAELKAQTVEVPFSPAATGHVNSTASASGPVTSAATPIAMHDPVQPEVARDAAQAAAPPPGAGEPAAPQNGEPRTRLFFESPTWHWPVFDPACCQECGRVIPMHETGWILEELILCEECFVVLDEQRTHRGSLVLAPAKVAASATEARPEAIDPPPAVSMTVEVPAAPALAPVDEPTASPLVETASPPAPGEVDEPLFELTAPPAYVPRVNFAGIEAPASNTFSGDDGPTLFDAGVVSAVAAIASSPVEDLFEPIWLTDEEIAALDAAKPSDAVAQPPRNDEQPLLAVTPATESPAAVEAVAFASSIAEDPAPETFISAAAPITEDVASVPADPPAVPVIAPAAAAEIPWLSAIAATMTFDTIDEGQTRDPATNSLSGVDDGVHGSADHPAFDPAIDTQALPDAFQLTPAPFAPRQSFASVSPLRVDEIQADSGGPTLFDLPIDVPTENEAVAPASDFVLTPAPFIFRPWFATVASPAVDETRWHVTDATTLFDAAIEAAQSTNDVSTIATNDDAEPIEPPSASSVEAGEESPVIFTLTPATAGEAPQPQASTSAAPTDAPAKPSPAPSACERDPLPPAPAPIQLPALEFKARKRSSPQLPRPSAPPLTFHHPVDVLLNELHNQHVDAQIWATLKRWRQMDPFHGEIEAMMTIAVELRDRWMARSDAGHPRRSTAG